MRLFFKSMGGMNRYEIGMRKRSGMKLNTGGTLDDDSSERAREERDRSMLADTERRDNRRKLKIESDLHWENISYG